MQLRQIQRWFACSLGLLVMLAASPLLAQFDLDDFKLAPELSGFNSGPPNANLEITGRIRVAPGEKIGLLEVTAKMDEAWHVYSLTQRAGGPMKSAIKLDKSSDYQLLGSFAPTQAPYVHYVDVFKMDAEEFSGEVTWAVPIEVTGNAPNLKIGGFVEGQVCADGGACIPFGEEEARFEATASGQLTPEETATLKGIRLNGIHTFIRSWLSNSEANPGDTVNMFVSFNPDPKWHVYAYAEKPPSMFQRPTLVQSNLPSGWSAGAVRSSAPIVSEEILPDDPPVRYYDGPATISIPIKIPDSAKPGSYPISGHIAYQTCATQCDPPTAIAWTSNITVAAAAQPSSLGVVAFDPKPASYDAVLALLEQAPTSSQTQTENTPTAPKDDLQNNAAGQAASSTSLADLKFESAEDQSNTSLVTILGWAFLGGFVLNFMPCVLPVIGLKLFSFVEQAGSDRLKAFSLNLWYALGMLAIFWVLAALAAAPALGLSENGLGWGEQFNYQGFAIPLICVVFMMALSFLGVWEIPIPGFATSNKASELTEQEGFSGAFFKGAITTILATPCSAPGLGTAYAFTVKSGSPTQPFLIFTVMGLGMAMPFLLIGAFPSLIRFLPKPGAWMDTFKQLLGFVLLGTVIFLLQNVTFQNLLPTFALLFGLWFACWWVGRVPLTAERDKRMRAWGVAIVIGILATAISFGRHVDAFGMTFHGLLGTAERKFDFRVDRLMSERADAVDTQTTVVAHSENALPWIPFSTALVDKHVSDGQTVMIDFTADWCLSCRTLEQTVLNTKSVKEMVEKNGVQTLVADWGTKDPEIAKLLDSLQGARQIPFLVIFPAGRPQEAIRFSGFWTRKQVIDALEKAGPSKAKPADSGPVDVVQQTQPAVIMSKLP